MTVEAAPRAFNHHLADRLFETASDAVEAWVRLTELALLAFWHDGNSWMDDEVDAFKKALKKVS